MWEAIGMTVLYVLAAWGVLCLIVFIFCILTPMRPGPLEANVTALERTAADYYGRLVKAQDFLDVSERTAKRFNDECNLLEEKLEEVKKESKRRADRLAEIHVLSLDLPLSVDDHEGESPAA